MKEILTKHALSEIESKEKHNGWTVAQYFDYISERATKLEAGTHVPKFTNPYSKATVALVASGDHKYLETAALGSPLIDITGSSEFADCSKVLALTDKNGVQFINRIENGDCAFLYEIAESKEQGDKWIELFKSPLVTDEVKGDALSKQLYWPLGEGDYHLISPVPSSSMISALNSFVDYHRFSEAAKASREKRRRKEAADDVVMIPNLAAMYFGSTRPATVSYLNAKRHGRTFMLTCEPPVIKDKERNIKPSGNSLFDKDLAFRNKSTIGSMRNQMVNDTRNNRHSRDALIRLATFVAGDVVEHMQELAALERGWATNLDQLEKDFVDTDRVDKTKIKEISYRFANWLQLAIEDKGEINVDQIQHRDFENTFDKAMRALFL